jgi:integrase
MPSPDDVGAAMKYVRPIRSRHGNGKLYWQFRRGGQKHMLPGLYGSDEFLTAYNAALASIPNEVAEIGSSRTEPGTVNALVVSYYKSAEWQALNPGTQRIRRPFIERFRVANGNKRVALLQRENIETMMAALTNLHARRHWLQAIRPLLQSAVPTMVKIDPTEGIKGVRLPKSKGHHTWTDDEIQQYRDYWKLGTQQRLVMEFALETFSRRSEVLRLGPQHIRDGRIHIKRVHGSKDVDILVTPELQAACDAMPKDHALYITNMHGAPRSVEGLGTAFAEWATEAGLPKHCRMHGLKKGGMRRLAESGVTAHEIMANSGHHKLSLVELYTADADRKKMGDAGMRKRIGNANLANLPSRRRQTQS